MLNNDEHQENGRSPSALPLLPYYVTIPESLEHTDIHLRLKKLVAKDGGIVRIDRGDKFLRRDTQLSD
jgi:hypothetical protein